jgi:MFS family permease
MSLSPGSAGESPHLGVSLHSLVRRFPMALGPLLGGLLIGLFGEESGIRLAFVCALILGLVSLVLQQAMIEEDPRRGRGEKRPSGYGAS